LTVQLELSQLGQLAELFGELREFTVVEREFPQVLAIRQLLRKARHTRGTHRKYFELRELPELFRHRAFELVVIQMSHAELGE
jgi:hypothetical protein